MGYISGCTEDADASVVGMAGGGRFWLRLIGGRACARVMRVPARPGALASCSTAWMRAARRVVHAGVQGMPTASLRPPAGVHPSDIPSQLLFQRPVTAFATALETALGLPPLPDGRPRVRARPNTAPGPQMPEHDSLNGCLNTHPPPPRPRRVWGRFEVAIFRSVDDPLPASSLRSRKPNHFPAPACERGRTPPPPSGRCCDQVVRAGGGGGSARWGVVRRGSVPLRRLRAVMWSCGAAGATGADIREWHAGRGCFLTRVGASAGHEWRVWAGGRGGGSRFPVVCELKA